MELYGLKTCDTCRKALKALTEAGHDVTFVDVRADGLEEKDLGEFLKSFGDELVNRRSTTWRNLDEQARSHPAADLLETHPTLMKRPVIRHGGQLYLGWAKDTQAALLG